MHTAENIIFADNYQQAFESLINCKCILSKSEDIRLTIVFRAHYVHYLMQNPLKKILLDLNITFIYWFVLNLTKFIIGASFNKSVVGTTTATWTLRQKTHGGVHSANFC